MQKGIALILTLITVATALAITLGAAGIFVSELVASQQIHFSTIAFYVADSAIEGALYKDRIAGGLADGFSCTGNGNGAADDNENGDTCLDKLDNGGNYSYTVTGTTPAKRVRAAGLFSGTRRSIEVNY
ncbi:MAG: hypothetical protein HY001_02685 [Candidatus Portnoybacteria bacterium]|nr:hypothetical protein [Candidatus Portnoybacteria bacterium]